MKLPRPQELMRRVRSRGHGVAAPERARAPRRFEDVHEYYHDSSSQNYIPYVRTPSLFLGAAVDRFLGGLPRAECLANPHTLLAVTPWRASSGAPAPRSCQARRTDRVGGPCWRPRMHIQFCANTSTAVGAWLTLCAARASAC